MSLAAPARGDASGFGALLGGGTSAAARAASDARPDRSAVAQAVSGGAAGSIGRVDVTLHTGSEGTSGVAEGTASARDVNLFGGRVVAATVQLSVRAKAGTGGGEAGITGFSVTGLLVDGSPVPSSPGTRVELGGLGTLTIVEQVADATGSVRANALRLEVTDSASGVPAGTQIVVGHLEAVAAAGDPPPPVAQPPAQPPDGGLTPSPARPPLPKPSLPRVRARALPPVVGIPRLAAPPTPLLPRQIAPVTSAGIGPDGYAFPVTGNPSFSDSYGAPRADTGWHHGVDIFAPEGTPLVAVADGTVFNVGVNALGGNRLWVRDERGNTFYYAHLSAYAPAAVEGARVRAGQVIGFVGHTGDAAGTPDHLHFEVHPGDGDSVDPYPYLVAWQRGSQVSLAFRAAEVATGQAPAAGALLVAFTPVTETPAPDPDGLAETVP